MPLVLLRASVVFSLNIFMFRALERPEQCLINDKANKVHSFWQQSSSGMLICCCEHGCNISVEKSLLTVQHSIFSSMSSSSGNPFWNSSKCLVQACDYFLDWIIYLNFKGQQNMVRFVVKLVGSSCSLERLMIKIQGSSEVGILFLSFLPFS